MDPAAQARFKEMRKPLEALTPVTEAMLRNPSPNDWLMWRGNYNALGLQRARPDQPRQREEPDGGVDVGDELHRHDRVHAARPRRHHVPLELRRADPGARRQERQPAVAVPPDDPGRLQPRHLLSHQAVAGDRRQQAHRADDRHAPHRPRHQDRRGGVGRGHRRLQEDQARLQRRSAGRQRQDHHGRQRLRARRRELLRHRPRPGDRQGAVAVQHRGAAGRAGQRDLERRAAREAVGRVGVDSPQLRPGVEPGLHRRRLAVPVVVGRSRHLQPEGRRQERRQPVHELDAGPQPRHRQAGLALPAPAERHLRSGLRLRTGHRAGPVAGRASARR